MPNLINNIIKIFIIDLITMKFHRLLFFGGWDKFLYLNMFYIIVAIQIILALLYVAYLIYRYAMAEVSPVVKTLVFFTWLLSFIIVVLLPYDIYHSLQSDYTMSVVWKILYYSIFVLTWLLLPVAQ